jgi:Fe-S oxidoreductase
MTQDSADRGVLSFIEDERARILAACTRCGKCHEVCTMAPYLDLKTLNAKEVVGNVLAVLAREQLPAGSAAAADALTWAMGCTGSGACIPACPESVNPKMMLRVARITALGGLGGEKLTSRPEDPDWFPRIRAFARTQLTDQEQKEWM